MSTELATVINPSVNERPLLRSIAGYQKPRPSSLARPLDWRHTIKHYLWDREISLKRSGVQLVLLVLLSVAALLLELSFHHEALGIGDALVAQSVVVFYNVQAVLLSDMDASLTGLLVTGSVARILFGVAVAVADLLLFKRVTGRPFDWEGMINTALVNVAFLLTTMFTFMNPALEGLLLGYASLVSHLPTLVHLNGAVALFLACVLGDFCFYWSHRWCHKLRFFWNLGHINHHRSKNLSQLTQSVDPHSLFLDTAGGKVFVLLLLPIVVRLFSLDIRDSGWALLALMAFDAWTNPSHSVALYHAEIRFPILRKLRWVFVTAGVHYTHHSREQAHNISDGSNFGARFTIWDRVFGTYVEPPEYIPDTGLFSDDADYIKTPLRFLLHPYVRMYQELRQNAVRCWPAIVFGPASYVPPVPVKSKA